MNRKVLIGLALVVGVVFAGVANACGGSDGPSDGTTGADGMSRDMEQPGTAANPDIVIDLAAEKLRFVPDAFNIIAGKTVMIRFENRDGGTEHDFVIEGLDAEIVSEEMAGEHESSGDGDMVALHTASGETASIIFRTTQKGTFDIYCTITGHRGAGMEGKVTVS